ncbi:hypothetical protein ACFP7A_06320 [Sporolactobacillus kofuensis]|uniref:TIGR04255 family protein n=1 Tax=Sporolactobacillus kofuensis TaxID=269672 RepID=A0ABW1WF87_9BACL|nr:hypothetical protein [Sporolactobacillus kofuensis]MCO7175480.1 hypothetical protein [Sporolactobacillus kofuensis]
MARYEIRAGEFPATCDFFYRLVSERVDEKYRQWKNSEKPRRVSMSEIYQGRKILGAVISYHEKLPSNWDYSGFIPYGLDFSLVKSEHTNGLFNDLHELYWGKEPIQYFESFFKVLALEVAQNSKYGGKLLPDFPKDEKTIQEFYNSHSDIIVGEKSLLSRFKEFTENKYDTVKWIATDDSKAILMDRQVGSEIVNVEDVQLQEKVLTFGSFEHFSEEIKKFVDEVFLPFMNEKILPEMINELADDNSL